MDKSNSAKFVLDRVKSHYNLKKDGDLADFLGIAQSTLSSWKSRDSVDHKILFAKCEELNVNWLLTGDGPVLKDQANEPGIPYQAFEEKVDNFVLRAIAQIEASDVDVEEKKRIARSLLRIAREELAKIEAEERSKGQDDQA